MPASLLVTMLLTTPDLTAMFLLSMVSALTSARSGFP